MTALARKVSPVDLTPVETDTFAADVVTGLTATLKRLPPKYFYDAIGSELFECITALPEYYLTRCEVGILNEHARDIAELVPPGAALIEFGSGSSAKTRIVLSVANSLAAYVPVDISSEFLHQQVQGLRLEYPKVAMLPVAADFSKPFDLPPAAEMLPARRLFSRLDHRQSRAARSGGVSAPCRPHSRQRFDVHRRRRSGQRHEGLARSLQRRAGCDRAVQSQSAGAHQSRAWRRV